MGTVHKEVADDIVAGEYPGDRVVKIVKYTNAWGGSAYGVIHEGQRLDTYQESKFVINPSIYWEKS
jgi:hypothetical protein